MGQLGVWAQAGGGGGSGDDAVAGEDEGEGQVALLRGSAFVHAPSHPRRIAATPPPCIPSHLPAAAIAHDGDDVARDALPAATELDAAAHPRVKLCAVAVPPPLQEPAQLRLQHAGSHVLRFQAPMPGNQLLDGRDQIRRVW